VAFFACSRKPEEQPAPIASAAGGASAADVDWTAPKMWAPVSNTSAIRKATYSVPPLQGERGASLCTVTKAGGTVDANIERWKEQFRAPTFKRSEMSPNNVKVTVVELRGEYLDMPPMPPDAGKPTYEMLAAIAQTEPELTFFKLIGTEKSIEAAKADFLDLVQSIHRK